MASLQTENQRGHDSDNVYNKKHLRSDIIITAYPCSIVKTGIEHDTRLTM